MITDKEKKQIEKERKEAVKSLKSAETFIVLTDQGIHLVGSPISIRASLTQACVRLREFNDALYDVAHALKDPNFQKILEQTEEEVVRYINSN